MWIHTLDSHFVCSKLTELVFLLRCKRAGICRVAPCTAKSSLIVNPKSANIVSPRSIRLKNFDDCVRFLSKTQPPQHFDRKLITSNGAMPIKNLTVLCFLQFKKVCEQAM